MGYTAPENQDDSAPQTPTLTLGAGQGDSAPPPTQDSIAAPNPEPAQTPAPRAELVKPPESKGYVAPENQQTQGTQTSAGYVSPENQSSLQGPGDVAMSLTPTSGGPNDTLSAIIKGGGNEQDIYQAHANGQIDDDQMLAALKGVRTQQQAKTIIDRAGDLANATGEAAKGVVEGVKQMPQLASNVGQFLQAQATSAENPVNDLYQYKRGDIDQEELQNRQAQRGSPILPNQATDPKMAGDWENVFKDNLDPTYFQDKYGVPWQPPTNPAMTTKEAAAKHEVASGIEQGQAQGANDMWWAAGRLQKMANSVLPPWMSSMIGSQGINPEAQAIAREHGINIPNPKPIEQMSDAELKSEGLTQSAKLQADMARQGGNPQNVGKMFLPQGTPSTEDIQAQGGSINPNAISGGAFLTHPMMAMMAIPGVDEVLGLPSILNPAIAATLEKSGQLAGGIGKLADFAANKVYGAGAATGKVVSKVAPQLMEGAGVLGTEALEHFAHMSLGGEGLGGLFMSEILGKTLGIGLRKPIGRMAELGVNTAGDVPKLLSMAAKPVSDGLISASQDLQNGTSLLATKGLFPNLIGRTAESGLRGAGQMLPYAAATAETPEQFGQMEGTGGALHMALGAPAIADRAVRNTLFDSAFIRDPSMGRASIGAKPFTYGTDPTLDAANASAMTGLDPKTAQDFHDFRQLGRGAYEAYYLNDPEYAQRVADLGKRGVIQNPDLNSKGVAVDYNPDQTRVFIRQGNMESSLYHEVGHAVDNLMSPEDQNRMFNVASDQNDPNQFALNYTNKISQGKASSDYDSLPTQAGVTAGQAKYVPGLEGMTKESIQREMRAETIGQLFNGQSVRDLTSSPRVLRQGQMALGSFLNKMGIDPTTEDARSVLGIKPSFISSLMADQLIRKGFTENGATNPLPAPGTTKPAPIMRNGRLYGPTGQPEAEPAPMRDGGWKPTPGNVPNEAQAGTPEKSPVAPQEGNVIKQSEAPVSDLVKEHVQMVRGFTPEEANQHVPPNADNFTTALNAALQSKAMAQPATPGAPAQSAPAATTGAPSAPPAAPAPVAAQQPQVGGAAGVIPEQPESPGPGVEISGKGTTEHQARVQKQLRSEGHNPGEAQWIAQGAAPRGSLVSHGPLVNQAGHVGYYGYPGDSSWDSKSGQGIGSFAHTSTKGSLIPDYSAALKESSARMRGIKPGQEFEVNGHTYRYDDTVPEWSPVGPDYVDVYQPSHAPDAGVSPEKIAQHQAMMAGIVQTGQPGEVEGGGQTFGQQVATTAVTGRSGEAPPQPPATTTGGGEIPPSAPSVNQQVKLGEEPTAQTPEGTLPDVRRTEESPVLPEDISQARENAVAANEGRKGKNLADEITKQVAEDVGAQHSQRISDGRVTYNPDTGFISGQRFVPGDAYHNWLLQNVPQASKDVIARIQDAIANKQDLHIDYGSAPEESHGTPTAAMRSIAQAESTAPDRAAGKSGEQVAGKNVMPSYVGVSIGKKGAPNSLYYGGPSPDKIASNAGMLIQRLGPESPYKAGPFGDEIAKEDLQGYLHNVTNGWKGDGSAQLEGTPDAHVPEPSPDFKPYQMPKEHADFWNLAMQGKGAGARGKAADKMGEPTAAGKAQGLAAANSGFMTDEGITNPLHAKLEQETRGWVDKNLHSGWEMMRADLTHKIHEDPKETAAQIHPGHQAVAQALNKEGSPPNRVLHAGFMPGDVIESPDGQLERVKTPAIRYVGKIYTGFSHAGAYLSLEEEHGHLSDGAADEGYLTNSGRFVSRNEAWQLAQANNQLKEGAKRIEEQKPYFPAWKDIATKKGLVGLDSKDFSRSASAMPGDAHIHAGDFHKATGIKLSKDPNKRIPAIAALLGPRHHGKK